MVVDAVELTRPATDRPALGGHLRLDTFLGIELGFLEVSLGGSCVDKPRIGSNKSDGSMAVVAAVLPRPGGFTDSRATLR